VDCEKLARLLRDARRKAAEFLPNDTEGMYDDMVEALSVVEQTAAPRLEIVQQHKRKITLDP